MPRKPRFFLSGLPVHIVQRGRSREPVFFEEGDYTAYLDGLREGALRYGCAIHAYVLMTNHVHVLATPDAKDGITRMMQYVGRRYVPYVNAVYGTSGSLWEGRYKASLIHDEGYLLTCMRYIELNPVRASMVNAPARYRWSSYRANANGETHEMLTPHPLYLALGRGPVTRQTAYRELFRVHLDAEALRDIRDAWLSGTPLGNDHFKEKIERKLKTKIGQARRGRPRKILDDPAGYKGI